MMTEKEYLEQNPGKHKTNYLSKMHNAPFMELISANGKKINKPNLFKCLKIKDSEIVFEEKTITISIEREQWEVREIKNIDYVKDNALVGTYGVGTSNGQLTYSIILGYIDENGMWTGYTPKSDTVAGSMTPHKIDDGLIMGLPQIFEENSSVVDFGCGNADYIKHLIKNKFECEAYDGNPSTPEMTGGVGKVLDLSKEFDLGKTFDYVISLEVAEHIPKEFEEIYVDNLIRHTGFYLITSWALDGQGGDGHVNEQNEDYVLDMYKKKGMIYNEEVSNALRNIAVLGWFKKTIYVFNKKNS